MQIIKKISPNFDDRNGQSVDMLVLHYTGMKSGQEALERLCDENAKVSAHYMIIEDGIIFHLVSEDDRAWHAGSSFWRGNSNTNQRSIGIEIVNRGHEFGYTPFPEIQMEAIAELCSDIISRHKIPPRNVVGHSDVAPTRKKDPGELFNWEFLAKKGIGLFPNEKNLSSVICLPSSALKEYGYDTTDLHQAITAFQRHFRPNNLSGIWDDECGKLLAALLEMI